VRCRPLVRLLSLTLIVASGCAQHSLSEGFYDFTATQTDTDTCSLLPSDPGSLWDGRFIPSGNRVWVVYGQFKTQLVGEFQEVSESFTADGSAPNFQTEVRGVSCQLDLVDLHMDGTADGKTAFSGKLEVTFESGRPECQCNLSVHYRAEKVGD
jgi:hypothetical protein